jgi:hypothetical protein
LLDIFSKIERSEFITISFEKLVLELNPLEPKSMEETFHHVHAHNNSKGNIGEHEETNESHDEATSFNTSSNCFFEKHL